MASAHTRSETVCLRTFQSLRIVTSGLAHTQSDILTYQPKVFDKLADAILEYAKKDDVKASVEAAFVYTCDANRKVKSVASVELFYDDGPGPKPDALFESFYAVPPRSEEDFRGRRRFGRGGFGGHPKGEADFQDLDGTSGEYSG